MTADIRTAAQREAERLYPNLPPEVDLPAHNRSRSLRHKAYVKGYLTGVARVTPTREQIAKASFFSLNAGLRPKPAAWDQVRQDIRDRHYEVADAILALMQ